jgi:hypothetical protein
LGKPLVLYYQFEKKYFHSSKTLFLIMKSKIQKMNLIKNVIKSFGLLTLLALFTFTTSCNRDNDDTPEVIEISEEDAVDVIEGALTMDTEGLVSEIENAAEVADKYAEKTLSPCGVTFDSTFSVAHYTALIDASYSNALEWTVYCNNAQIPENLDFGRESQGAYETTRMESFDASSSMWNLDNLILGTEYTLNGDYSRSGSQTSKVRNQNSMTSTVTMSVTNLSVDKGTRHIESGTADITVSGSSSTGHTFSFEAEVIFQGDGSALVVIDGTSYEIDLY